MSFKNWCKFINHPYTSPFCHIFCDQFVPTKEKTSMIQLPTRVKFTSRTKVFPPSRMYKKEILDDRVPHWGHSLCLSLLMAVAYIKWFGGEHSVIRAVTHIEEIGVQVFQPSNETVRKD